MKKTVLIVALALMSLCFVGEVFANNVGVGLGTVLLEGKTGKLWEVLAVTTNATFYTSTFAITSGTSGYKEGAKIGMKAVDAYIAENMDALAVDIAKGEGEYLETLAHIMKIENKEAFKNLMHRNFDKIYASENVTSTEVTETIKNLVG